MAGISMLSQGGQQWQFRNVSKAECVCQERSNNSMCKIREFKSLKASELSSIKTSTALANKNASRHKYVQADAVRPTAAMVAETRPKADHGGVPKVDGNGAAKRFEGPVPQKSPQGEKELLDYLGKLDETPISVQDYMEQALEIIKPDNGPPRWFCPANSGQAVHRDAPLLLFLPGMDGTGLGLVLHHKTLGPLFEVRCLHIPVKDRTPFEGLLKIVEDAVKAEHRLRPTRPIYLVGDSFGGTLALAVAARNPSIDFVLILANPATSIARSQLQPLFPVLSAIPDEAFQYVPYFLSFTMGDPLRMASAKVSKDLQQPLQRSQKLREALVDLLPTLPTLAQIMPRDALVWKLKLIRAGALYANSRLHAVRAEVLVLASGKDQMLPSVDEAKRLKGALKNCKIRIFKDSGHTLLLEDGLSLATIIKATLLYRRSKERDIVLDYVPPTKQEFQQNYDGTRTLRQIMSPVFLSTNENGQIIKGLDGVPNDRPILLVGNHMLMGLELSLIVGEFHKERNLLVRGVAHPMLFSNRFQPEFADQSFIDQVGLFGAIPVSGRSFYKLLESKASVLLYPGGAREALHKKGEEYKLFWPEQSEFVRMAARFGATIVPFSGVGEDDILQLLLDYDDLKNNALLRDRLVLTPSSNLRPESAGEVANQPLYLPVIAPKVPGRLYFRFGKPIPTAGRWKELQDRKNATELYLKVKREVESGISYLLKKRNEDPYRQAVPRLIYEASWGGMRQGPSFEP